MRALKPTMMDKLPKTQKHNGTHEHDLRGWYALALHRLRNVGELRNLVADCTHQKDECEQQSCGDGDDSLDCWRHDLLRILGDSDVTRTADQPRSNNRASDFTIPSRLRCVGRLVAMASPALSVVLLTINSP